MTSKAQLREQCLARRNALSAESQRVASAQICEIIQTLPEYQKAQHIALYRAFGREVNVDAAWLAATKAGKTCYFPKLVEKNLQFLPAAPNTPFEPNRYGILEPLGTADTLPDISLFIVPLVAFDKRGYRIGHGQGHYDRALPQFKQPFCIGVGYAFQEVPVFKEEKTDYLMDVIVTEERARHFRRTYEKRQSLR